MNTEDWVEICLQNESPMFKALATSSAPTALVVKGTEQYPNGLTGVDLYQVGSYGSAFVMPPVTQNPHDTQKDIEKIAFEQGPQESKISLPYF